MQNLFDHLQALLNRDERFFSADGKFLRDKTAEAARLADKNLLRLLLDDELTRAEFFTDADAVKIFNAEKFINAITRYEFLADSYTRFANKIGLVDARENFIARTDKVALVFPYKDCVLEGGQTKDDQSRNEIFYNATLARADIDRLLEPKVFVNATRHTAAGSAPAQTFNADDNLIVKGNNLLALASLIKRFRGKVKCIYIDPPFNTGSDSFNYNDRFNHSTWLVFMKNRLELAKNFLADDGNIFIHIDINQSHYLKVLADEIFGINNFVEEIIWAYGSPSGGRAATPKPVNVHDYILHYAKNYSQRKQNRVYIPYSEKYISDWFKYTDEDGRRYQRRQRGTDADGNAVWSRQYLDESKGVPLSTVWTDIQQVYADPRAYKAGNKSDVEVIKSFVGGQKPEALIQRVLEMSTAAGDLVMDFFLGSGTTAAVAHKLGRRYIGVEQMDYIETLTVARLKKVIGGEQGGISKRAGWRGGGSFVYCELAAQNQKFFEAIERATGDDLPELYEQISASRFISDKVLPAQINSCAAEFSELTTGEQKRLLLELLDKNLLYVNLCDMDDADFAIGDADKIFTRSFYGGEG